MLQVRQFKHLKRRLLGLLTNTSLFSLSFASYSNLKPGGWLEFQEFDPNLYSDDDTLKPNNNVTYMLKLLSEACDKVGRTLNPAPSFKRWVEEAGFKNIEQKIFKSPIGTWPKDQRMVSVFFSSPSPVSLQTFLSVSLTN